MSGRAFADGFSPGFGAPHQFGTLLLKVGTVGPDPAYQDGDIVVAINRRWTRSVHAQHLCHPRVAQRNGDGLIVPDHFSRDWFELTHQFRFERVSATTVVRTHLVTSAVDVIGATPNANGEAMDVALYVARRRLRADCALFGADGAEVWYGGRIDESETALTAVWNAIEAKTPHREADFPDWPLGQQESKTLFAIRVDDFDDAEAAALVEPEVDLTDPDTPVLVRKRRRRVPWRALPGLTPARIADIENPAVSVDLRAERKHPRALYVQTK